MNVSFVLLQGVLALESLAAALRFTDEPGVSFAGFLVLLKAARGVKKKKRKQLYVTVHLMEINGMWPRVLYVG